MREIYDFTSGVYMGSIPEASHTFNVVGNMNEHQVAIGETTFDGLPSLLSQPGAIMDYYSLMWVTLQRASSAREAILIMDNLTQTYGYASTGESFSISDPLEVWIMEMMSKGPGEKGSIWVARRVPPGYVCGHANQARIQTWPRDDATNGTLWAEDVVSFAVKKGLYPASEPEEAFSFSDVFDPVTPAGARLCELRVWNFFRQVVADGGAFAQRYLSYVQGRNLTNRMPLWVAAGHLVSVNDTMWYMRSHYTGTWFDQRDDVGAGAFHAELRKRPVVWKVEGEDDSSATYVNERNVGYQGTFFHFVAQGRSWLPYPVGGIIWFGVDDSSHSVRTPMYSASAAVPPTWAEGNGNTTHFVLRSAYWAFNLVANLAYSRYDLISPDVQAEVVATEQRHFAAVAHADKAALALLHGKGSPAAAASFLTNFSVTTGDATVDGWISYWQSLVVRYRDGLVVKPGGPPVNPKDRPQPADAEAVGYDKMWYARIARETGDRYLLASDLGGAVAQRRDLNRRKLALLQRR